MFNEYNTPGIIKIPFMQMTAQNPNATYACLIFDYAVAPDEIRDRSILIEGDADKMITDLLA